MMENRQTKRKVPKVVTDTQEYKKTKRYQRG